MNLPIHWTAHEREAVAAEALRIHEADPRTSPFVAVQRAQAIVLTKARQRPLHKTQPDNVAKWLTPLWDEMRKTAKQAEAREHAEALFPELPAQAGNGTIQADGVNIDGPQAVANAPSADDEPPHAASEVEPTQDTPNEAEAATSPIVQNASNIDATQKAVEISAPNSEDARKPARRQVHWKDDEKRAVAARAYSAMKSWPDMSRLEAFRKAQDFELSEDRRRTLTAWEQIREWAEPMLEALALDEKIEAARIAEEREAAKETERERETDEQGRQLAFNRAVAERMNNLTFDDLIHALARRFGRAIAEGFNEGFRSMATPPIDPPPAARYVPPPASPPSSSSPPGYVAPPTVEPNRQRLPKVCVVGLIKQQLEDVRKCFLGVVDFEFVKSQREGGSGGHGGVGMLDRSHTCDAVFAMVDFLGHDVEHSAKRLSIPFVRVNGSTSALKRELRAWLDARDARLAA